MAMPSPFIDALPKTETHLHFEGALPFSLLQRVRPGCEPPASWAADFKFRNFAHFETELLDMAFAWFTSPERYHEAGRVLFASHIAQNVKYVETSFASAAMEFAGLDGHEVAAAIRAAAPPGLEVRVFLGIHHRGFGPGMRPKLEAALGWKELSGVDLHGVESDPLDPWTAEYWAGARRAGKYTKAHAGEFMGADFVRRVLDELQPQRIEHGVRSVEDPAVVAEIRRRGIALDVCPTSNHKLMPGVTLAGHPIRTLYDSGVTVTLSSDDPISFGNTVTDEYRALERHRGFTRAELAQIARNGFSVALVGEEQRRTWLSEVDRVAQLPRGA